MGNPATISLGPGKLKYGLLGTTEPSDLTSAWPTGWVDLGYTHSGSVFNYQLNTEDVEVAEELDPLRTVPTGRKITVEFMLAEITASNFKRSLNGGIITAGSGFVYFEPPAFGSETRAMYGWESDDAQERMIYRQCFSSGQVSVQRQKGANKAGIPFTLNLEKPAGVTPYRHYLVSPARA